MVLSPYSKQAFKWLAVSVVLYVATVVVREVAWAQMIGGGGFALAFIAILILGVLGTVALGCAIYFALLAV